MKKKIIMPILALALISLPLGQINVKAQSEISIGNANITYTDKDNSGTINLSDEVTIGTEKFYVLRMNEDTNMIRLLSEKNIDMTTNLQSDTPNTMEIKAGSYSKIQGDELAVMEAYANSLNQTYGTNVTGDIVMPTDVKTLTGNNMQVDTDYKTISSVPAWFYSTNYLTGNCTIIGGQVYGVMVINNGISENLGTSTPQNVQMRPVIEISPADLQGSSIKVNEGKDKVNLTKDGNKITIELSPEIGYILDELTITANNHEYTATKNNDGTYSFDFDAQYGDVTIDTTFKKMTFEIKIEPVKGAIIGENAPTSVEYGDNAKYIIKADKGYKLKSVKVNGEEKITEMNNDELTLTNVTEEQEIVIETEKIAENEATTPSKTVNNPKTLDNILIYIALLFLGVAGIGGTLIGRKYIK